jgi:hypothetical protein
MAFEDITHPNLWGIKHIPTGKLLRQQPQGYGHTQLDLEDSPNNRRVKNGIVFPPRLFTNEDTAKRALIQWLQGVHRNYWEDGLQVSTPTTPRIKEEFKVVPIYLYTDADIESHWEDE